MLKPKILLVEDEAMVSLLIEDILIDRGYDVVGPCANTDDARKFVDAAEFDVALLDINLGGDERVFDIAVDLRSKEIPFAFVTGYGHVEPGQHGIVPVLCKPFTEETLTEVVQSLLRGRIAA